MSDNSETSTTAEGKLGPPLASAGFAAVARPDARVLILGTLPGRLSLERQEYYAQPRNAFWKIMGRLFDFDPDKLSYPDRTDRLLNHKIALWDVCGSASRRGSLDTAIHNSVANNFTDFFAAHREIKLVCFNGSKAEQLYRRHVLAGLPVQAQSIRYKSLPSTSPAHAAMPFDKKCDAWSVLRLNK